jgi:uncharacterized protein
LRNVILKHRHSVVAAHDGADRVSQSGGFLSPSRHSYSGEPGFLLMKRLMVLAMLTSASLEPIGTARADDNAVAKKAVEGSWQGQVIVTPQIALRITLDVATGKDGSLSGTWGSPDQGAKDLPVDSILYTEGILTFSAKTAGAMYIGKLSESGTEVVGEWAQGGKTFVLNFKRIDPSKVVMQIPKELLGIWEGKLQVNGGIDLRVVLKVEQGKDAALKATLASPDQGANDIPIGSIGLKGNMLTFESKIIEAKFTGKKNEQGTAFDGEFSQHGVTLPLSGEVREDRPGEARRGREGDSRRHV